jgi:hypothetical protein
MPENLTVGPLYARKIDQVMVELTLDLGPGLQLIFAQAIHR